MPMPSIDLNFGLPEEKGESRIKPPVNGGQYDLIIIGGGPAGMTAAVYAARKHINTLMVTKDLGGQVLLTSDVENYIGYSYISGAELIRKFEEQLSRFELNQALGEEVIHLVPEDEGFTVTTRQETEYHARTVVIASGKRSRALNVPGEKALVGRGVSYCATCDAPLFGGMDVAVVGGGNSALEAVMDLLPIATKVFVVNFAPSWQADPVLIEKMEKSDKVVRYLGYEVVEIQGKDRVGGLVIRSRETGETEPLSVGGVFIEIGLIPNSEFAKEGVRLNRTGEVMVDCACRTSVPGIFGAGDVTTVPEKQIIVAAGEGAKAALSAYTYLVRTR